MRTTPSHRGFSLIELLVAVSITLVIAGIMLSVTVSALNLWRRSQDGFSASTQGKFVLDILERDLQAAFSRRDSTKWFAAEILDSASNLANHGWLIGSGGIIKPATGGSLQPLPPVNSAGISMINDARFGLSGIWLRFISTNVESGGSLPCLIAYNIARRPVVGDTVVTNLAPVRYSLYRSAISNSETFGKGYDVTSTNYASSNNAPYSNYSGTNRNARNAMNPSHANLLTSNVVDFGCWLYARNIDGTLRSIYPDGNTDISHIARGDSSTDNTRYPEVADVMVRILTEEGAKIVEAMETDRLGRRPSQYGSDAEWWWAVVEANSHVMVRRIEIKGSTL